MSFEYFWDLPGTIEKGHGFSLFGKTHLAWLLGGALFCALMTLLYRRSGDRGRKRIRLTLALLMIADELFKHVCLLMTGQFKPGYLPLHLCGISIFVCLIYAFRPGRILGNWLYLAGLPGALGALLFPNMTKLPVLNFFHLHTMTLHILIVCYIVMLLGSGELVPDIRCLPGALLLLGLMALAAYGVNRLLGTNFFYLMHVKKPNPLYYFGEMWGNHLYGIPVLLGGVILVLYGLPLLVRTIRSRRHSI